MWRLSGIGTHVKHLCCPSEPPRWRGNHPWGCEGVCVSLGVNPLGRLSSGPVWEAVVVLGQTHLHFTPNGSVGEGGLVLWRRVT